jgi:uncharacterized surface protein with fasciclin (FAS1) repeats
MGVMSTSLPPLDTIKHLLERLKANDVAWFRERYKAGDLAWLKDRLPAGGYEKLGERIEAGDLGWLRERIATLPGLNIPGLDLGSFGLGNIGGAAAGAAGAAGVATGALKGATSLGTAGAAAVGSRKRGLWFIPILLLAAIAAALLMKQCNKDDSVATDSEIVAEETEAEATDATATEAPGTEAMTSEAMAAMAETTVAAAPATEGAAAGGDIVATAQAAGSFNTLLKAVDTAGLTATLQGPGPFTVFAPTDEAFAKLPPGAVDALLKPENKPVLEQILKYHIVGAKVPAADVKTGPAKSVEGSDLDLVSADGKVTVNGANVTTADVASSNGLIHVIDAVLIPKSVDVAALLGGAAPATEAAVPATEAAAPVTEVAAAPVNAAGDAVSEDLTVYFANGSAAINAEGKAKIENAVVTLSAVAAGTKVNVVGHASAVGDPAKNQKLSEARANNVINALKAGLADKATNVEFTASAEGDKNPVENADKSRRVTVEIQK